MKSLYWHFVKRDCQDNLIGWVFIGLLVIAYTAVLLTHDEITPTAIFILGALFYFFSMFQQMTVWGGGITFTEMCLSRHYLQSLPIPRDQMFRLCFRRGLFPIIPLFLFFLFLPMISTWFEAPQASFELLKKPLFLSLYLMITSIELFFVQLMICRQCLLHEALRKTIGRHRRFFLNMKYMTIDVVLGFVFGLLPVGFLLAVETEKELFQVSLFVMLGLPFHLWQLWRSYKEWMFE